MPAPLPAYLNAIGTAVPGHDIHEAFIRWARDRVDDRSARLFDRMAGRSGIAHRWSVLPPTKAIAVADGVDSGDTQRIAGLSMGTFWFILPSLPMFIALPMLLRSGIGFWGSLAIVIAGTLALYALMFWAGPRLGLKL